MFADENIDENVPRSYLKEQAWIEACREAWIRSEEAGCDVGRDAICQWIHKHWPGFLRSRWLEHIMGIRQWAELRSSDFGILRRVPSHQLYLLNPILDQLKSGGECLTLAKWCVRERDIVERDAILDLLTLIDVNSCRMRCDFADEYIERLADN